MKELLVEAYKKRSNKINKIEKLKQKRLAKEAINNLKEYAKRGYDSILKEDKEFFLKSFGIFDKEKTNGKNSFMLRIRIPGGRLNHIQAKTIGEIAKKYGKDYIDLTTRAQMELRYLKIEDLPTILEKLESVGITTYQTGVDNFRNIVTNALDGISKDSVIETYSLIQKLQSIFLKKSEWISVLPRKFNTAIVGSFVNDCNVYGHDCAFLLSKKNNEYGFNIFLGGKVGIQAKDANLFVKIDEVEEFYYALISLYKQYGFRDNRNKNRLYFLIEAVGLENFVEAIKEEANKNFDTKGELLVKKEHIIPKNSEIELKNSLYAIHFTIPSGIFSGSDLLEVSEIAKKYGGDIRLSVEQNFYICNIKKEDVKYIKNSNIYKKYEDYNNIYFKNMIACAGIDTCAFAVIKNKPDAIELSSYLKDNLLIEDGKVRLYWSACPKGCGIHGVGDIGFEGCKIKDENGATDGVHIFLGGKASFEAKEARVLLKSVKLNEAKYIVANLLNYYKQHKKDNESFENFDSRVFSKMSNEEILKAIK